MQTVSDEKVSPPSPPLTPGSDASIPSPPDPHPSGPGPGGGIVKPPTEAGVRCDGMRLPRRRECLRERPWFGDAGLSLGPRVQTEYCIIHTIHTIHTILHPQHNPGRALFRPTYRHRDGRAWHEPARPNPFPSRRRPSGGDFGKLREEGPQTTSTTTSHK